MVKKKEVTDRNKLLAGSLVSAGVVWLTIWVSILLANEKEMSHSILPLGFGALILALGWAFYIFRYKIKITIFLLFLLIATLGITFLILVFYGFLDILLYGFY